VIAPATPEVAIVPDVLADRHAEALVAQRQNLRPSGGLKVAVLVEHVVGGQQGLVKHLPHAATGQQRRGVVERSPFNAGIGLGQTDEQRRALDQLARKILADRPASSDERAA
jgi:hypothetical protein